MDIEELTIDAISDTDLNKIKLLSNCSIIYTGPEPNIQYMVAKGQLENRIGT